MSVLSYTVTQYTVECDNCGVEEICVDNNVENVHSKQQAIKWAGYHQTKDRRVLCGSCFQQYKKMRNL